MLIHYFVYRSIDDVVPLFQGEQGIRGLKGHKGEKVTRSLQFNASDTGNDDKMFG